MGNGKQRVGKNIKNSILYLILGVILLLCSGCSDKQSETEKSQEKVTQKQEQGQEQKQAEKTEIPQSLLPGSDKGKTDSEYSEQGDDYVVLEDVETAADNKGSQTNAAGQDNSKGKQEGPIKGAGGKEESLSPDSESKTTIEVDFEIESASAESYGYSVYYSALLSLKKGASVYEALEASGVNYTGSGYISGIEGLYEADCGQGSGWTYLVNGIKPNKGCQNYILKDGDKVQWSYVLNP